MSTPAPVDERGTLSIADDVVEKLAVAAAGEIDGVGRPAGGGRATRTRARVQRTGDQVEIGLTLAIVYPANVMATADATRDRVRARLADLAELTVGRVDVDVAALPVPGPGPSRRVVA